MKAIRVSEYGGPAVLKIQEVPTPEPGPNQVLVRNHAVGINPVDTYLRSNTDNRGPKLPYTPGSDAAGVVEAVGQGVTAVKAGAISRFTRRPYNSVIGEFLFSYRRGNIFGYGI